MVREVNMDLFSVPQGYYLAHSISADYNLGAGVAKEIDERFNMELRLADYSDDCGYAGQNLPIGSCITIGNVYNLVTKSTAFTSPKYSDLLEALRAMKCYASTDHVSKIAMPRICCGKDKLDWNVVKALIEDVFDDEIEIMVCSK